MDSLIQDHHIAHAQPTELVQRQAGDSEPNRNRHRQVPDQRFEPGPDTALLRRFWTMQRPREQLQQSLVRNEPFPAPLAE